MHIFKQIESKPIGQPLLFYGLTFMVSQLKEILKREITCNMKKFFL